MPRSFDRRSILEAIVGGILSSRIALALAVPGKSAGNPGPAGLPIPSSIVFRENAQLDVQPFGDLRYYLEGSTGQLQSLIVGYLELKVGKTPHAPHTHPEEELMIFIEGHGEISLEGKVTPIGPGAVVFARGGSPHALVNTGTVPLTVYYVKWIGK